MKDLLSIPEVKAIVAGIAGGAVRALALREKVWPDAIITITVGAISSVYFGPALTPALVAMFRMPPRNAENLAGFIVGISGVLIVGAVLDYVRARAGKAGKQ